MPLQGELMAWKESGTYILYGPFEHQVFVKDVGDNKTSAQKTLLLLHGFPESSYSYHAILDGMSKVFDRIILFDFLGYGLSDKPTEGYTYSLFEQADTALVVWKHLGVKGGHLLSHDMGDSVNTELIARHQQDILPSWFSDGFQSVTFTNGSMVLDMATLTLAQKLMLSSWGWLFSRILSAFPSLSSRITSKTIHRAHGNSNLSSREIEIMDQAFALKGGTKVAHKIIQYLNDRRRFEQTRWLPALSQTKLPVHICWGDDDGVARVKMAYYLHEKICQDSTLTIMKGIGHFCQLDHADTWVKHIGTFFKNLECSERK